MWMNSSRNFIPAINKLLKIGVIVNVGLGFYDSALLEVATDYKNTGRRHKNPIELDRMNLSVFTFNLKATPSQTRSCF